MPLLSYPSYLLYPISSIDGKHRATAGMGMMRIVWNSYSTSGCKMLPIRMINPVRPYSSGSFLSIKYAVY